MKLNLLFASFVAAFLFVGCSKNTSNSYLLSSGTTPSDTDSISTGTDGDLAIQADNETLTMAMDDSDKIEITGTCKDLNRKKNRVLVEVFAGEDETVNPYISNATSDKCVTTDAGIALSEKCFWVTKGVGLIEGVPALQQVYPQCHDGKFSFAVKLGQILVNPILGLPNLKYTVRFKLRTLDGVLAETAWSRVTVDRTLLAPGMDLPVSDATNFACTVTTSPARFNQNIRYTLTRSFTDSAVTPVSASDVLYTGAIAGITTPNDSVFSWRDDNNATTHASLVRPGMVSGVTYGYQLTARETQYAYPVSQDQTKVSAIGNCEIPPPTINNPTGVLPTTGTCYATTTSTPNPALFFAIPLVRTQWAYSLTPNWTGPAFNGVPQVDITSACDPTPGLLPTSCTISGLAAKTTYYIAMREISLPAMSLLWTQTGKWSNILACTTP